MFKYDLGENWSHFYSPNFSPMFEPIFSDPVLEEEARSVCGDDEFCLFDIAATKRVEIGMSTMEGGQAFDLIVEMAIPSEFGTKRIQIATYFLLLVDVFYV